MLSKSNLCPKNSLPTKWPFQNAFPSPSIPWRTCSTSFVQHYSVPWWWTQNSDLHPPPHAQPPGLVRLLSECVFVLKNLTLYVPIHSHDRTFLILYILKETFAILNVLLFKFQEFVWHSFHGSASFVKGNKIFRSNGHFKQNVFPMNTYNRMCKIELFTYPF